MKDLTLVMKLPTPSVVHVNDRWPPELMLIWAWFRFDDDIASGSSKVQCPG